MEILTVFRGLVAKISYALTLLGGYALLCAALLICVDVFLRKFEGMSVLGSDELSGYALAIGTGWALSFAFVRKSHIRIDIVRQVLPDPYRSIMDVFAVAVLFIAALLLSYFGGLEFVESVRYSTVANTPLRVPLWIPQSLWASGLVLFATATGLATVEALLRLFLRDYSGVSEIAGMAGDEGQN